MRRLINKLFRRAEQVTIYPPDGTEQAELLRQVASLQEQLLVAKQRFEHARRAQAAIHRHACELRKDWPHVHRRYFTNEGIAEREAGLPMNPRKQRKK